MADRPATEPRTPTGRAYLAELNGEKEPPEEWRDARGYLPKASRRAWEHDRDMILAIEAEAAQGAAPLDQHEGGPLCIDCDKPFQHQRSSGSDAPLRAKATATSEGAAPRAEGRAASPAALDVERLRGALTVLVNTAHRAYMGLGFDPKTQQDREDRERLLMELEIATDRARAVLDDTARLTEQEERP